MMQSLGCPSSSSPQLSNDNRPRTGAYHGSRNAHLSWNSSVKLVMSSRVLSGKLETTDELVGALLAPETSPLPAKSDCCRWRRDVVENDADVLRRPMAMNHIGRCYYLGTHNMYPFYSNSEQFSRRAPRCRTREDGQ